MVVRQLIKRIMEMPIALSILYILGIIAPILVLLTLTLNEVEGVNINELFISMVLAVPSVYSSILIYKRKKLFIYLYPISYMVGTSVTPFLFSTLIQKNHTIENFYSSLFLSFLLLSYFLFSKDIKNYISPPSKN